MLTGVVILLSLIALLAIPVSLDYRISLHQTVQKEIRFLWLFGLIRVKLSPRQQAKPKAVDEALANKRNGLGHSSSKGGSPFAAIREKRFRRRIIQFMKDLWRAIHKKDVTLRMRIGLGDPAETGQLWAIAGPLAGTLSNVQSASITIEPDFYEPTFQLESHGMIKFIPLQLIYLTIQLLLSPPFWHGMKLMGKTK